MFCTEIYFQSLLFVLTRLHKGNNGNDDDGDENDLIEKIAPRILAPLTVSIWNNALSLTLYMLNTPQANYQEELTNVSVTNKSF